MLKAEAGKSALGVPHASSDDRGQSCEWPLINVAASHDSAPSAKRNRKRSDTSLTHATLSPPATYRSDGPSSHIPYPTFGSSPPITAPLPAVHLSPGLQFNQGPILPPHSAWPQHGVLVPSRLDEFPNLLADESPLDEVSARRGLQLDI